MKIHIALLTQAVLVLTLPARGSTTPPVSTPSTYDALASGHTTTSTLISPLLSRAQKQYQEKMYGSTDLTGPTGLNALIAKTGRFLEIEDSSAAASQEPVGR